MRLQAMPAQVNCQLALGNTRSPDNLGMSPGNRDIPPPEYNYAVETFREAEYPVLKEVAYLDHGGATVYAKSVIDNFSKTLGTTLYGNPHSQNTPARLSGEMVDKTRDKTLRFLGADPNHFDLVFVANATAAIKLVAESFRNLSERTSTGTFWYGYHRDAHTSLIGVRELTGGEFTAFGNDARVETWLDDPLSARARRTNPAGLGLFAYPGQSNLSGRRLPVSWIRRVRERRELRNTYTLFDAAALAMTSPLDSLFENADSAPDFTCLSFYKIFGFPDIGALVVRKASGHVLRAGRKYFGGGTISQIDVFGTSVTQRVVSSDDEGAWPNVHDGLEDGTLPFHSILALGIAIDTHRKLYSSMAVISRHTGYLTRRLYDGLGALCHANRAPLVRIYDNDHEIPQDGFLDTRKQGPTVAFNILKPDGSFVKWTEVERMANEEKIYIRAGGVCCPGGVFSALEYEGWEWQRMFSAGHRCGGTKLPLIHEIPTGIVRASLGAMSTIGDVDALLTFLRDTFLESSSSLSDVIQNTSSNHEALSCGIIEGSEDPVSERGWPEHGQHAIRRRGAI